MPYSVTIPRRMTNEESKLYAMLVLASRDIAYAEAKLSALQAKHAM